MLISMIKVNTERIMMIANNIIDKKASCNPQLGKNIAKLGKDLYSVNLMFKIESKEEEPFPYNIELVIKGVFKLEECDEEKIDEFLNINAIQILFPYLRSTLSSVMAAAMIPPIILPVIDARTIFQEA